MLETEGHGAPSESSDEKEECETGSGNSDIWEDSNCMELLQTRVLLATVDPLESKRIKKRVLNYLPLAGAGTVLQKSIGSKARGPIRVSGPDAQGSGALWGRTHISRSMSKVFLA